MPWPAEKREGPADRAVGDGRSRSQPYGDGAGPATTSAAGTTSVTSPSRRASSAGTVRGCISSSLARATPTMRGSVQDEPESADRPTPANAVLKPASSAITRKSQANAKAIPAPAATPLTAATTGLGIVARAVAIGV